MRGLQSVARLAQPASDRPDCLLDLNSNGVCGIQDGGVDILRKGGIVDGLWVPCVVGCPPRW